MSGRNGRRVHQLQLRLQGDPSVTDMEASLASLISEVNGRVARLHRLGSQYAQVRVSRYVEDLRRAAAAEGLGGHRVAKEV